MARIREYVRPAPEGAEIALAGGDDAARSVHLSETVPLKDIRDTIQALIQQIAESYTPRGRGA
jgi:hypothetical protein